MSTRYQKLTNAEEQENNPSSSSTQEQQITDLQDSFGESFDEEEEHSTATDRLLPQRTEVPQPSQPIVHRGPAVLPVSTDGVFANMSAKPETESNKLDETPPTYEEAAADATPPYWQTTIIAPAGMGDMILVEGMPVGISASFQFVGFMLTYLLHTSHASKNGSRTGLGVSLVQMGFYIRSRGTLEDDEYFYSGQETDSKASTKKEDGTDADIIAYLLMMLGWFIIIRALADYFRAKQMEKIICSEPTVDSIV
ncbi:hypothetical protein HPULCUR_001830 [Helicostylum pulchrum]|uniref:Uncharacterized protein n=1 Tax=Helicostylum pulchrum TaxID=562976 RepID=A0ABP9XPU3_9FUNG